jgi:ABC-type transport system substrate-binding protein
MRPGLRLFAAILATALGVSIGALAAEPQKVLRYAFPNAETNFDPAQVSDNYSQTVNVAIFDTLLTYEYLKRPFALKPNVVESVPEAEDNGKRYVFKIRPGIYFADDPAFGGKKRELTAHDFAYSMKRFLDPRWRSPNQYVLTETLDVIGAKEAVKRAQASGKYDYEADLPGIQVRDRYTLVIRLATTNYNFLYYMGGNFFPAVAREVVEKYGDDIGAHPVGTNAFRLAFWKRSAKIILEANPNYREHFWDEDPGDDPVNIEIARRMKGKRIPQIGRLEIDVIAEQQPRWLAFLNEDHDYIERVPNEFAFTAFPNDKLAPGLAKRGITMDRWLPMEIVYTYFNMEDPVVGGYSPEKVALRRALVLAYNVEDEIRILRKQQAIVAYSPIGPGARGYDPEFRSQAAEYDAVRARALLDMYGYIDRDGDGYRENPDGSKLVVEYASSPELFYREMDGLWKRSLDAIGVKIDFKKAPWQEHLKTARAGKLQMWFLSWNTSMPDAEAFFTALYGPNKGQSNHSRFALPAFDELFRQSKQLPDGPERNRIYRDMERLFLAYAPWKLNVHRISTNMSHPSVIGARWTPALLCPWKYVDVDPAKQPASVRKS